MKKIFKYLVFIFVFFVVSTTSVFALTITETTGDDTYDTISDGSIIMGVTKFNPNMILTAKRASVATVNDISFILANNGSIDEYESTKIYYLLMGEWFAIDEENNINVETSQDVITELNSKDIYYVDNIEKILEVNCDIDLEEGYELVAVAGNSNRSDDIIIKNKKIFVPATILSFDLYSKNVKTEEKHSLISYTKEDGELNSTIFEEENIKPSGTISRDPGYKGGKDLVVSIDENTITFDGLIEWYAADSTLGRQAGNMVGVKITAPSDYDKDKLLNTTIKFNGKTYNWSEVSDDLKEGKYVYFYPIVSSTNKEVEIEVSWIPGYTETFTIKIADTATFKGKTVATINGVNYDNLQEAVNAINNNKTLTLLNDVVLDEVLVINKTLTLDLDGHKIINEKDLWNESIKSWSLISVRENGNLTITGNGTLKAKENDCYAIDVQEGGKVTINDGTFVGNISAVYAHKGEAVINGGTYSIQQLSQQKDYRYLLNCYDENYKNGDAKITVLGGTFNKFNPANNLAEGNNTNFVLDGYKVTINNNDYTVLEDK